MRAVERRIRDECDSSEGLAFNKALRPVYLQRVSLRWVHRERSDRMVNTTNQTSEFRRNIECAIRSLRSRYCTVGMLLFVQRRLVLKIREAWSDVASFVSRLNLGGNDFLF